MKKIILLLVFLCSLGVSAQQAPVDKRNVQKHGIEQMKPLLHQKQPELRRAQADPVNKLILDSVIATPSSLNGNYWCKDEYKYDEKGNVISETQYIGDGIFENWIGSRKSESTYNEKDKRTLDVYSDWDADAKKWVKYGKGEYSYDANNKQTLSGVFSNWDADAKNWIESWKSESCYDENNKHTLNVTSRWDADAKKWIESWKYEYSYDKNNNQTATITSRWDADAKKWIISSKDESTYDENNNLILDVSSKWDATKLEWIPVNEYKSCYDANNKLTLSVRSNWDADAKNWIESWKNESSYDKNGYKTLETSYVYVLDSWTVKSIQTFYYSEGFIISIEQGTAPSALKFTLYPNPATSQFSVVGLAAQTKVQLMLINMSGQVVLTQDVANNSCIDISALPVGSYVVSVVADGKIISEKLIKR